jgi:thioredoxin reductase
MWDAIVVGGSYAGLAAALQLVRGRRRVLVVDAGQRRNRFASEAHGFLGQDGRDPAAIAAAARAEVLAYPTAAWLEGSVVAARADGDRFALSLGSGEELSARRLVLATGIIDELPDVPGVAERWGRHVFHCPYCHGYELGGGRIGALATAPHSIEHSMLLSEWGPTTLLTRGLVEPDADQLRALERHGVTVERTPVTGLEGGADVRLADGRLLSFAGLFLVAHFRIAGPPAGPLATQLGCELEAGPVGAYIRTDATKETTVRNVFACGDAALPMSSIAFAVADGVRAGAGTHRSLVFR